MDMFPTYRPHCLPFFREFCPANDGTLSTLIQRLMSVIVTHNRAKAAQHLQKLQKVLNNKGNLVVIMDLTQ